jgi:hypothetical protein
MLLTDHLEENLYGQTLSFHSGKTKTGIASSVTCGFFLAMTTQACGSFLSSLQLLP